MNSKIIDLRHNKYSKKIAITFYGNRPFSDVYNILKIKGYNIFLNNMYSNKEYSYCIISLIVTRKVKSFEYLINHLANEKFCKILYIHNYFEIVDIVDD